jgi:hypothetical protein
MTAMTHAKPKVKAKAKAAAGTAAGAFFLANPLISAFIIGAGLAVYFTYRYSRS